MKRKGGSHKTIMALQKACNLQIILILLFLALILVAFLFISWGLGEYQDGQRVHTDIYRKVHQLERICK